MTRRILHIGISATAFCLPACLSVGSDLPPHLRPNGVPAVPESTANAVQAAPRTTSNLPMAAPRPTFQPAYVTSPPPTLTPTPPLMMSESTAIDSAIQRSSYNRSSVEVPKPELADVVVAPRILKEEPLPLEVPALQNVRFPDWPEVKFDGGIAGPAPYAAATPKPRELNGQGAALGPPLRNHTAEPVTSQAITPIIETPTIPPVEVKKPVELVPVLTMPALPVEVKQATPIPAIPAPPKLPADSPLVKAVRCLQQNKPEEALEALRQFDPATQELLSNLIHPLIRISKTPMEGMNPDEAALLVEQFTAVSDLLKTKAALTAGRICYCNGFRRFGDIDEDLRPAFARGSTARVYVEIKNFLAEPALLPGRTTYESQRRGYRIRLLGHWELRDAANNVVYSEQDTERKDLNWVTPHITPPQDYWLVFGIPVPPHLRPGTYTLWIQVTDVPTGRTFRRPIEFRIAG